MTRDPLREYYARRAAEYEQIYAKPERQEDLAALHRLVPDLLAGRNILEIACGTGYWTERIAPAARSILATDVTPEVLEIARTKSYPAGRVRFALADAFAPTVPADMADALSPSAPVALTDAFDPAIPAAPADTFDPSGPAALTGAFHPTIHAAARPAGPGHAFSAAFAGFWWSHIPVDRIRPFLSALRARIKPGARVVFIDNRYVEAGSTPVSRTDAAGNSFQLRRLADGSTHEVLKNFPSAAALRSTVAGLGFDVEVTELTYYWCLSYLSLNDPDPPPLSGDSAE